MSLTVCGAAMAVHEKESHKLDPASKGLSQLDPASKGGYLTSGNQTSERCALRLWLCARQSSCSPFDPTWMEGGV